jgi:hypothetical protein
MLCENTGRHMLDSGGHYGRNFERNEGRTVDDFEALDSVTLSVDGDLTVDVFHYMVNQLEYCESWDVQLNAFIDSTDYTYFEAVPAWLESLGIDVSDVGVYDGVWEWNTYNWECLLSQTLQGWTVTFPDGVRRSIVQVHGGADVRGGYTRPRVFDISWNDDSWIVCDNWQIICEGADVMAGQLDVDGVPVERVQHTFTVGIDGDLNLWNHCNEITSKGVKLEYVPCPDCGSALNPLPLG